MDPAYSIAGEPDQPKEKNISERIRELLGQEAGYLATAADAGLLGAPSFAARKLGLGESFEKLKAQNPYQTSAEIAGGLGSMALPVGLPSKLSAGALKIMGNLMPKASPKLGKIATDILSRSESLEKLKGLRGMASRGAVNAAWQAAPREAMKESPDWGSVPLEAAMGAVTGPIVGKITGGVFEKAQKLADLLKKNFPEATVSVINNINKIGGKSSYVSYKFPGFQTGEIRVSDHATGISRLSDYVDHVYENMDYDPTALLDMLKKAHPESTIPVVGKVAEIK